MGLGQRCAGGVFVAELGWVCKRDAWRLSIQVDVVPVNEK